MSAQKRKKTVKRKKKNDVSIVGDLFRILFAVSMLIVAILIAFFVFQNINGFQLPELTTSVPEITSEPITIQNETTEKVQETRSEAVASETETTEDPYADVESAIASAEALSSEEYDYEESDYTDENEEPVTVPPESSTRAETTEETLKQEATVPPDAEIVDGPGVTLPPETIEGGFHGPV